MTAPDDGKISHRIKGEKIGAGQMKKIPHHQVGRPGFLQFGKTVEDIKSVKAFLFDKVMDLAEINRDKMFFDKNDQTEITGTYRLEYDANKDILYYSFRINEYSEVCINAKTGDFTEQHFWDGVYVD